MSSYASKPSLVSIPFELKVIILKNLDSIYDLEALSATCSIYRSIINNPEDIPEVYLRLLLHGNEGELIRALSVCQGLRREGLSESLEDLTANLTVTKRMEYLKRLLQYRTTICWLSNQFFRAMADRYGEALPGTTSKTFIPSRAENMRLNTVFLAFWLLVEGSNFMEKSKSMGDEVERLLDHAMRRLGVGALANPGVPYAAGLFLSHMLGPVMRRYSATLGQETIEKLVVRNICLDSYNKYQTLQRILSRVGLDGYRNLLLADEETQNYIIEKYNLFPHDEEHTSPLICALEPPFFAAYVDNVSKMADKLKKLVAAETDPHEAIDDKDIENEFHSRPLWRQPGVALRKGAEPWNQGEEFDLEAMFCDDDRLERLGYFRRGDDVKESREGISLVDKLDKEECECEDEWWCSKKYEVWKIKTGYYGKLEDAPGWGVHFRRREYVARTRFAEEMSDSI